MRLHLAAIHRTNRCHRCPRNPQPSADGTQLVCPATAAPVPVWEPSAACPDGRWAQDHASIPPTPAETAEAERRGIAWLLTGAWGLARWVLQLDRTTAAVVSERLAQCRTCPHFRGATCARCGCVLQAKLSDAAATCPDSPPRW